MAGTISLNSGTLRWWIAPLGLVASMAVLVGASGSGVSPELGQVTVFVGYVLLATLIAWGVARSSIGRDLGLSTPCHRPTILIVSVVAAGITLLLARVGGFVDTDISQSTETFLADIGFGTDQLTDFYIILTVCCLAPLGEEALYRGLVFRGVFNSLHDWRGSLWGAWIVSILAATLAALVFAFSHGGEGQGPSVVVILFLSGIVYGLCYAVTGSLWAAVIAHSLNNTVAIALPALPSETISLLSKALIVGGPVLTVALLWLWTQLVRSSRPDVV